MSMKGGKWITGTLLIPIIIASSSIVGPPLVVNIKFLCQHPVASAVSTSPVLQWQSLVCKFYRVSLSGSISPLGGNLRSQQSPAAWWDCTIRGKHEQHPHLHLGIMALSPCLWERRHHIKEVKIINEFTVAFSHHLFSQPIFTKQDLHEYLWNGFDFPKKDSSQLKKDEGSLIQWGDV